MTSAYTNLYIDQGSTYITSITLDDAYGDLYDLTNFIAEGQIRKSYYSRCPAAIFDTTINANTGTIVISLAANVTSNIFPGQYVYDTFIRDTANNVVTKILEGVVYVNPSATRSYTIVPNSNYADPESCVCTTQGSANNSGNTAVTPVYLINNVPRDISGTILQANTAQVLVAANPNRKGWWLLNTDEAYSLWFNEVSTATIGSPSVELLPGAYYEAPQGGCSPLEISIISPHQTLKFTAREW